MVLGALLGYFVPGFMAAISVVGDLFMRALQLLVAPLVISAIIAAIASLREHRRLGRPLVTVLVYFVGTTVIAVGIGLALALALVPGWGVSSTGPSVYREAAHLQQLGVADILRHVHLSETNRDVLGTGHWPTAAFLDELSRVGYDHFCSVGVYSTRLPRAECIRRCREFLPRRSSD